jgi:hypothetical protein
LVELDGTGDTGIASDPAELGFCSSARESKTNNPAEKVRAAIFMEFPFKWLTASL